jgi:hypothetical protein
VSFAGCVDKERHCFPVEAVLVQTERGLAQHVKHFCSIGMHHRDTG